MSSCEIDDGVLDGHQLSLWWDLDGVDPHDTFRSSDNMIIIGKLKVRYPRIICITTDIIIGLTGE